MLTMPKRERTKVSPSVADSSTVRRVSDVLGVFLDSRPDAGVTEIARAVGCSKSVVHRIVVGLVGTGFMSADPLTRRYRLGPKALQLGVAARTPGEIGQHALPYLRNVRERTGETGVLSLLRGEMRFYAQQVESQESVRQTVQIGREVPLHLGAGGKAILAFLPPFSLSTVVRKARRRSSSGSAVRSADLEGELARVRRRGYAISLAELAPGAVSVAAPVFDRTGVIGSIGAAGVSVRSEPQRLARYGAAVRAEALAFSRELGWRGHQRIKPR